nr:SGNH/GDSL hydrolase family protein [Gordonia soli]
MLVAVSAGAVLVVAGCSSGSPAPGPTGSSPSRTGPSTSASAVAPEGGYVNLGDSFSAGTGVTPTVDDSPVFCLRSQRNFAHVLAEGLGRPVVDVSCGGADTTDFTRSQFYGVAPQLDAVKADTRLVTLMIGGNDSDVYAGAIRACSDVAAADPTGSPCQAANGSRFTDIVTGRTGPDVTAALRAVHERAPQARVIVVGYPWLLPPSGGCYPTMRVAAGDVPYLRDLQSTLNATIADAARETGTTFVDMSRVSEGHDACSGEADRWVEPQVGARTTVPVHPNAAGQRAIADQVRAVLG